jgi:hypothetical protein
MPDFDSSMKMALKGLTAARAALKHCIIISDGDPSLSDPTLPGKFKQNKITISTIAIAPHGGMCVGTLRRIAAATGGRYYYPQSPNLLPQIFIKEAMTVRRSVIFKRPFTPIKKHETDPIKGFWGVQLPQLEGYVATTAKDRAEVPLTAKLEPDGMEDPVLAHWRYGEGKSAAFTSSAASDWAAKWIPWPGYVKFWSQLARWASREGGTGDLQIRSEVKSGRGKVVVEAIDEKGRLINYLDLTGHVVDPKSRSVPGVNLVQTAPGRYEAEFAAGPPGAYQINVSYQDSSGVRRNHTTGVANSYSPEFSTSEGNPGMLKDLARATGGEPGLLSGDPVKDREAIWARNLPPGHRIHPGWQWLLWAILVLFPLDVAVRRLMIDWRAIAERLRLMLGLIVPRLRPAMAEGPDPTMAALMAEKERLREAAPPPATGDVRSRFMEQIQKAREGAPAESEDALAEMLRRHKERREGAGAGPDLKSKLAAGKGKRPAAPKPSGISGYAGALLDAKKRALKKREQDKDKDGGKSGG